MPSVAEIRAALARVEEPELHRDLVSLNMVKAISVEGDRVSATIELTTPACPLKDELRSRIEKEIRSRLKALLGPRKKGQQPRLAPVVVSDVYFINNEAIQDAPVISIGGPGVNAVSALLAEKLPAAVAIENVLVVQMDLEWNDLRCAVWGMDHLDTVRAVELFLTKGYLETFLRGVVEA